MNVLIALSIPETPNGVNFYANYQQLMINDIFELTFPTFRPLGHLAQKIYFYNTVT
jgi:hypothetical protein